MVSECGIPCEIDSDLPYNDSWLAVRIPQQTDGGGVFVHIDGEFAVHPHQLPRICLELLDAGGMDFAHVDRIAAQGIDDLEVMAEHVRMLVVLFGDVLADRRRKRYLRRPPKWKRQDVGAANTGAYPSAGLPWQLNDTCCRYLRRHVEFCEFAPSTSSKIASR